jgi:hypothetical protein
MPTKANVIEYQTVVVGAAYLVKGILNRSQPLDLSAHPLV